MFETLEYKETIESSLARFGVDLGMLSDYRFDTSRKKFICIHSILDAYDDKNSISVGIPFLRHRLTHPKLTTAGALLIGHLATRNIVNLNSDETVRFLKCELMNIQESTLQDCDKKGFAIARCNDRSLGLAFQETDDEGIWLKGLFPARWRTGEIWELGDRE